MNKNRPTDAVGRENEEGAEERGGGAGYDNLESDTVAILNTELVNYIGSRRTGKLEEKTLCDVSSYCSYSERHFYGLFSCFLGLTCWSLAPKFSLHLLFLYLTFFFTSLFYRDAGKDHAVEL